MINNQHTTDNQQPIYKSQSFDLVERTAVIGEDIINFCKKIPQSAINNPLISQLIRSGTSIGANYAEANEANSKKDFRNKICIAKKEAKETLHWLRMIVNAEPKEKEKAREIYKEVHEIILIFSASIRTSSS